VQVEIEVRVRTTLNGNVEEHTRIAEVRIGDNPRYTARDLHQKVAAVASRVVQDFGDPEVADSATSRGQSLAARG
jgi:hypothetical protein